ncbi:Purple acid phosphatase 15 [Platanthera guangdongensis]|uniref:Purple acid phosphatase 15 n=1 Tax=Platanthera guangdongensis TaxID=2320717 RepID=A0ABR2M4H8_9ASPA
MTLDGPFPPEIRRFDHSLRRGSYDIPTNDLRLAKKARSNFPEQIVLAASFSPTSMLISWVTNGPAVVYSQMYPFEGLLN